jgi:hypothetical protein
VYTAVHAEGFVALLEFRCSLFPLLCVQINQKLFPNDDVSNSTILTALKGAKQVSNLYPKELDQGCCMKTRDHHEYDTFNPDQIISVPSDRNADGSIDIIMSTREGKVIRRTEVMTGMLGMTLPTLWNRDDYFRGRSYQGKQPKAGCLSL